MEQTMTSPSEPKTLISYCCQCDAEPGQCNHHSHRYLEPIEYEKAADGWKVPNHERKRWEDNTHMQSAGKWPKASEQTGPPLLRDVSQKLEHSVFITEQIQALLQDAYLENPHQTAILVDEISYAQKAGRLNNAGGLLVKRLRELLS
jgi:hypothetical protein